MAKGESKSGSGASMPPGMPMSNPGGHLVGAPGMPPIPGKPSK